jgi:rhomboid protease GluP
LNRFGRDLGVTTFLTTACIAIYVLMVLMDPSSSIRGTSLFDILPPSDRSLILFGISGAVPVFQWGFWWSLLTAGWLHGSLLHIVFNMMGLRQLAPAATEMYGPGRMLIIYTLGGVTGFIASSFAGQYLPAIPILHGAAYTVGASAPLCGLLGALMYYGKRSGSSMVTMQAKSWVMSLVLFGFLFPGIDNWAHAGGFAGGYLVARFLDPLQPERLDHLIIGIACLAVTGIAIVFSIVHGLRFVS